MTADGPFSQAFIFKALYKNKLISKFSGFSKVVISQLAQLTETWWPIAGQIQKLQIQIS